MSRIQILFKSLLICTLLFGTAYRPAPEEGMYPISFLSSLNFEEMGMNIKAEDVFNENGTGIINAIVKINGCTGSFISKEGLILTNHHCVFSSLKPHTNEEQNYMRDGFLAQEKVQELPMEGYSVRIMKSYTDVSRKVLAGTKGLEPLEKDRKIAANIKEIESNEQKQNPSMEIEISEMLTGSSYILFRYEYLKDLRLVYVPPRYIGEFGGETDNWMWPRHSGDFSFVRAYVGKDGKPAEYSKDNVPYSPKKHLKVDFGGVKESDLVFILGYPGRTDRHQPAEFIRYMEQVQMPYIVDLWEYQIDRMEKLSERNDKLEIKYATRIKRLANTTKNYRGKLQSLKRIGLYEKKKGEEALIQKILKAKDPTLADEYMASLEKLNKLYQEKIELGERRFWYGQLAFASKRNALASTIVNYAINGGDLPETLKRVRSYYNSYDPLTDSVYTSKMLKDGIDYKITGLKAVIDEYDNMSEFIKEAYEDGKINDSSYVIKMLKKKPSMLLKKNDPLIDLHNAVLDDYRAAAAKSRQIDAAVRAEMPTYVNLKMQAKGDRFIPDANATLRFTYGSVKGYSPSDAIEMEPVSTLKGIVEKSTKEGDYDMAPEMLKAIAEHNMSEFYQEELGSVPVNLLYNTDTSGGNSGSPILDKDGELIGLNFDRVFEACVNDFAWDDSYSRSIGVDMRYILWVTKYVGQANHIIEEVKNS